MNMDELHKEPGIYFDIPWSDYVRIPYMSPSKLKRGLRSMKHLKRAIDNPEDFQPSAKTVAVGNAAHAMLSGEFDQRYLVQPEFELDDENVKGGTIKKPPKVMTKANGDLSSNGLKWQKLCEENGKPKDYAGEITTGQEKTDSKLTKYYKDKVSEFESQAANQGKEVLTTAQVNTAEKVIREIQKNPEAVKLLGDCQSEVTVISVINGLKTKTRIDILKPGVCADLKTTTDVETNALYRKCKQMGYFFQFAFHIEALANAPDGFQAQEYLILAAEDSGDYDTGVIPVPFALLDQWRERVHRVISDYRHAKATGVYGGLYPGGLGLLKVPEYDMDSEDELHDFDRENELRAAKMEVASAAGGIQTEPELPF